MDEYINYILLFQYSQYFFEMSLFNKTNCIYRFRWNARICNFNVVLVHEIFLIFSFPITIFALGSM